MSDASVAGQQQRLDELCAASIRALSGGRALHYRGGRLHDGQRLLPRWAAHLHPARDGSTGLAQLRGAADGLALRLLRSDAALHRHLAPQDSVQRLLFDLLEQFRVEALPPTGMPGLRHNLLARFDAWSLAAHHGGLTGTARGLLLYTVAQVCRARVTGDPTTEATEDLMESTRFALAGVIGHALAGLRRSRHDQAGYAVHALAIAEAVAQMLAAGGGDGIAADEAGDHALADPLNAAFGLLLDRDSPPPPPSPDGAADPAGQASGDGRLGHAPAPPYRIFTRAHDRCVAAAALARPAQLAEYRAELDAQVTAAGLNLPRLARELHALLAEPLSDGWDSAQAQGRIDGRRLAQLVARPSAREIFRTEHQAPQPDTVLGLLLDCSGSMRQHSAKLVVLVDLLLRALTMAGVASELLGYSTNAWNGGKARRDWLRAGSPASPGRLNEALHIVFKPAQTSWQQSRRSIAALLKPELYREGIDGEAVDWACTRLQSVPARQRLLVVVSDGCPMDSASQAANGPHLLDQHLREVLARRQAESQQPEGVRIFGLGLALDLSPYYRHSRMLDLEPPLRHGALQEVLALLRGRQSRT